MLPPLNEPRQLGRATARPCSGRYVSSARLVANRLFAIALATSLLGACTTIEYESSGEHGRHSDYSACGRNVKVPYEIDFDGNVITYRLNRHSDREATFYVVVAMQTPGEVDVSGLKVRRGNDATLMKPSTCSTTDPELSISYDCLAMRNPINIFHLQLHYQIDHPTDLEKVHISGIRINGREVPSDTVDFKKVTKVEIVPIINC